MEVISSGLTDFSEFEKCQKRLNLVTFHLNKMIDASCLNEYEKIENIPDERLKELFEQLIPRCDVSNFSDDVKLKKDVEHHINKNINDIKQLNEDYQVSKNELKLAKNQVFDLLQKLSLARTEAFKNEELNKQKVIELGKFMKENNYLKEQLNKSFLNEKLNQDSNSNINKNKNLLEIEQNEGASNFKNDIPKCNKCDKIQSEKENLEIKTEQLAKELERLRHHLLNIEECHNNELIEINNEDTTLKQQLKQAQQDLENSLLSNAILNKEMSEKVEKLKQNLDEKTKEVKDLRKSLTSSQSTIEQYSSSILNLHSVLEQYEKNQRIFETAEIEKTRRELANIKESKKMLVEKLQEKDRVNAELKNELSSIRRQETELETMRMEYNKMKGILTLNEKQMDEVNKNMAKLKMEENGKIDKILMKNLFVGYLHACSNRKEDVACVIGKFLDFNADDYQAINAGKSKSYKEPNLFQHHSFYELFVKFLETESAPLNQQPHQTTVQHKFIPMQPQNTTSQQQHLDNNNFSNHHQSVATKVTSTNNNASNLPLYIYLQSLQKQQKTLQQTSNAQNHFTNQNLSPHFSTTSEESILPITMSTIENSVSPSSCVLTPQNISPQTTLMRFSVDSNLLNSKTSLDI